MLHHVLLFAFVWNGIKADGMFKDFSFQLPNIPGMNLNTGIAVTNVGDGRGPLEWIIASNNGPNIVLRINETTGKYENIALPGSPYEQLADPEGSAIAIAACDLEGDGLEEIYILNSNRRSSPKRIKDRLFKWFNGRYQDVFLDDRNTDLSQTFEGRAVSCLDRTGSGKYGFLIVSDGSGVDGKIGLLEFQESESEVAKGFIVVRDFAKSAGIDFSNGGRGAAVGPILGGDGFSDILVLNEANQVKSYRGENYLFKNDGKGSFKNVAGDVNLADEAPGRAVSLADFNNDGYTDVVYGNWLRPHKFQLQSADASGNSRFTDVGTNEFSKPSAVRTVIAADFDNSGMFQVFMNNLVYPGMDGVNKLYRIEPNGQRVNIVSEDIGDAAEADKFGTGAAVADINGDGVLEMLVAHGESRAQPLSLYYVSPNKTAGNNWLRVFPLTQFTAPARGAKVTVTLNDGRELTRIIDGGSGYLSQSEPVAHFGLGKSVALKIKITWPDNHSVTKNLSADDTNKFHTISFTGN
ncbi:unnamed protein product [Lymnaea stagnalis]|uniref:ASPIC/UnbV domain-containing protein n=1 Tax=Lymnaea stagnalis TaxID=6523 RepID=A0AAV2I364_LYMST